MVISPTILNRLKNVKIAVIGDMMLDSYTFGTTKRVSPEAPVLIVQTKKMEDRPGGAGNVMLNLLSLGASVVAVGRLGQDPAGDFIKNTLEAQGALTDFLIAEENYSTPLKNRIIANDQQIVRIDSEEIKQLSEPLEQLIIDGLPSALDGVAVIAISDYGKGFLSPTLLAAIFQYAAEKEICVITDPKGSDFSKYQGTTIIKPNLSEAYMAANLPLSAPLEEVALRIFEKTKAKKLMITRSEDGVSIFYPDGMRSDFPVRSKEVVDVTGAGDSVLAMLAFSIGNGLLDSESAHLCNIAGAIAIEQTGCAKITLSEIAIRLLEKDGSQKIFDEAHSFVVKELLKNETFNLLIVEDADSFSLALMKGIQHIHAKGDKVVLFLSKEKEEILQILSSFQEVNLIISDFDTVEECVHWDGFKELYLYEKEKAKFIPTHFEYIFQYMKK